MVIGQGHGGEKVVGKGADPKPPEVKRSLSIDFNGFRIRQKINSIQFTIKISVGHQLSLVGGPEHRK